MTEAIDAASRETTDRHLTKSGPREGGEKVELRSLLDRYLSHGHRHPSQGCSVAALCSEVGHGSKETKKALTGAIERLLTTIEAAIGHDPGADRESAIFAALAGNISGEGGIRTLGPAFIGEFGVTEKKVSASRVRWISGVMQAAMSRKMVPVLWETGQTMSRHPPHAPSADLLQVLEGLRQNR